MNAELRFFANVFTGFKQVTRFFFFVLERTRFVSRKTARYTNIDHCVFNPGRCGGNGQFYFVQRFCDTYFLTLAFQSVVRLSALIYVPMLVASASVDPMSGSARMGNKSFPRVRRRPTRANGRRTICFRKSFSIVSIKNINNTYIYTIYTPPRRHDIYLDTFTLPLLYLLLFFFFFFLVKSFR